MVCDNQNVVIVGLGPHAKRIYVPVLHNNKSDKKTNRQIKKFFSMGVIAFDPIIFEIVPNFETTSDLEVSLDYLFGLGLKKKTVLVSPFKYNDDWGCLHDAKDIMALTKFFKSL